HEPDYGNLYELIPLHYKEYKRYFAGRMGVIVRFKDIEEMDDFYNMVPKVWANILEKACRIMGPNDKVGLEIRHPALDDPIPFELRPKGWLTGDKIANKIAKVQQSKKELKYGEQMYVEFTFSRVPQGKIFEGFSVF
ncbi:MAG: hypothetical protein GY795_07510, partial [Desulfobacterales bacterium]|nr:hypothetical protein [Desulfobacterales bacterium]